MKQCHINLLTSSHKSGQKSCHIKLPFSKIKMRLFNINSLVVSVSVILILLPLVFGDADSDASIMDGLLTGQNRAAKPESFLDRIAALFGGGNKNQNKGYKSITTNHLQILECRT